MDFTWRPNVGEIRREPDGSWIMAGRGGWAHSERGIVEEDLEGRGPTRDAAIAAFVAAMRAQEGFERVYMMPLLERDDGLPDYRFNEPELVRRTAPDGAVSEIDALLRLTYQTRIRLVVRSDGTGLHREIDEDRATWVGPEMPRHHREEEEASFDHGWDLEALAGLGDEDLVERLGELFWEEVNEQQDDPFLMEDDDSIRDVETEFHTGSQEELERLVRLVVHTEPDQSAIDYPCDVWLYPEGIEADNCEGWSGSPRAKRILDRVLAENSFSGESFEYNDGISNRRSGYGGGPTGISVEVGKPSAHGRLEAIREMRAWLEARFGAERAAALMATSDEDLEGGAGEDGADGRGAEDTTA